jgi:hypothetical protein
MAVLDYVMHRRSMDYVMHRRSLDYVMQHESSHRHAYHPNKAMDICAHTLDPSAAA